MRHKCIIISILVYFTSCQTEKVKKYVQSIANDTVLVNGINIKYPFDYTIFPPEFYAPTFEWQDNLSNSSNLWYALIMESKNREIIIIDKVNKQTWKPDSSAWEKMKRKYPNSQFIGVVVKYLPDKRKYLHGKMHFSFSRDSVGADIFFRAVTLPFSYAVKNVHTIEWYMGSVKGGKPRRLLTNLPVCGNCHSFPMKGKPKLAMDVDYGNDKGSYTIVDIEDTSRLTPDKIITWADYKREENEPTFGLLSQISPDGNYVLSTVKDLSVFVAIDNNLAYSQLFFPIKGILGIYDIRQNSFSSLPGANDPKYVQSNPSWFPDGKQIIFARTEAYINEKVLKSRRSLLSANDVKEFTSGTKPFKFSLYKIDFNDGKGGIPEPIKGASYNNKSNYFAKVSPDGKWIVFCMADNFMLLQPDSRLYIMPIEGGEPRLMRCNLPSMNSWHSWSPNSRWLVFSSKYKGLYTQLYLTYIDENGNDSPPVLLENLQFENRACNIPEFYPYNAEKFKTIKDEFSQTAPYYTQLAADNMESKLYKRALNNIEKAIKTDTTYIDAYFRKFLLNATLRQHNSFTELNEKKKVKILIENKLKDDPKNPEILLVKATLFSSMDSSNEAIKIIEQIIRSYPNYYKAYEQLASIYRKTKQYKALLTLYDKMIQLVPHNKVEIEDLIIINYVALKQYNKALALLNKKLQKNPNDVDYLMSRANLYISMQNFKLAEQDLKTLNQLNVDDYKIYSIWATYHQAMNNKIEKKRANIKALELLEKHLNKNPEDVPALFEKANILSQLEDWPNVEKVINKILELFPLNYEALVQKARIKIAQKQWHEVIQIYSILLKNYRPEEEFYNNRAIANINLGRLNEALSDLNNSLTINPQNYDTHYNKIKLLKFLGDIKSADLELKKLKENLLKLKQMNRLSKKDLELLQQLDI